MLGLRVTNSGRVTKGYKSNNKFHVPVFRRIMNIEKTKERLRVATQIASENGQAGNPAVVAALIQSLATDELTGTIVNQTENLIDKMCQAAAVAAGN